jgi:hypothetical protein
MKEMRPMVFAGALCLLAEAVVRAQSPALVELDRANQEVRRLSELYEKGAVSRNRLDEAKTLVDDANDDAILRRTLYGIFKIEELTPDQIEEMLAAARRRLDRIEPRIATKQKLIDAGVMARNELRPELDEREMRQRTLELAEARAKTFDLLLDAIRAEEEAVARAEEARQEAEKFRPVERYDGTGAFRMAMLPQIEKSFEKRFGQPLPISALGMTELHRAMGFDHTDRVDIALTPDSPEGQWLRGYLEANRVPYFAFRSFVPGQATGAHIHIGPASVRLARMARGVATE